MQPTQKKTVAPVEFKLDAPFLTVLDGLNFVSAYSSELRETVLSHTPPPALPVVPAFIPSAGQRHYHIQITIVLPPRDLMDVLVNFHNHVATVLRNRIVDSIETPLKIERQDGYWGSWNITEINPPEQLRAQQKDSYKIVEWHEAYMVPNTEVLVTALNDIAGDVSHQKIHLADYLPNSGSIFFTANLRLPKKDLLPKIRTIAQSIAAGNKGATLGIYGEWRLS